MRRFPVSDGFEKMLLFYFPLKDGVDLICSPFVETAKDPWNQPIISQEVEHYSACECRRIESSMKLRRTASSKERKVRILNAPAVKTQRRTCSGNAMRGHPVRTPEWRVPGRSAGVAPAHNQRKTAGPEIAK